MYKIGVLLALFSFVFLFSLGAEEKNSGLVSSYQKTEDSLKVLVFTILEEHCNECHLEKKPMYLFTKDNMNAFAPLIKVQVFVKRKMPKGKDYPLTEQERKTLQNWLDRQLKEE